MSDGTLRHFYAEVVSNCGSNHRKGGFLLNCAAALHALRIRDKRHILACVVRSLVGRVVSVVCGQYEQIVIP